MVRLMQSSIFGSEMLDDLYRVQSSNSQFILNLPLSWIDVIVDYQNPFYEA